MRNCRIFLSTLMMLFVLCVGAENHDLELQRIIRQVNEQCPMSMGAMGEMTSASYEKGDVVMVYRVNENVVNIDALNENKEMVRRNVANVFSNADGYIKLLVDLLASKDAGMVVKYIGKQSNKVFTMRVSAKVIKEASVTPDASKDPMAFLKSQVEVAAAQLPMEIADGMTLTRAYLDGKYLVYEIVVNEHLYSIDTLRGNYDGAKEGILSYLNSGDPTIQLQKEACRNANIGIAYQYVGQKSGKTFTVKVESFEM